MNRAQLLLLATVLCAAGCRSNQVIDGHARFQVLSPWLVRLEYAADGHFETGTSFNAPRPAPTPTKFTTRVREGWREIETSAIVLRYRQGSGPFAADNVTLELRRQDFPVVSPFAHRPERAISGWMRALDGQGDPVGLHDGLLNRDGWYVLDDTRTALVGDDGWIKPRQEHNGPYQDVYLFTYGRYYSRALLDFVKLTGPPPMLPRWAFGTWFSRFHAYSDREYRQQIVPKFRADGVPLDVLVIDTDWKSPARSNGWSWNKNLFPDPKAFLAWTTEQGLHVTLNIHPSILASDPLFAKTSSAAGGLQPIGNDRYGWDWGNRRQAASYFALHDPFEAIGVRFWWLDWCCDPASVNVPVSRGDKSTSTVAADSWINHLYAQRATAHGQRGFAFSRIGAQLEAYESFWVTSPSGPWADHRSTIHFTGDTFPTWGMFASQVAFTVAEGSTGFPYVSHDLGSFFGRHLADDLYVRWVQFGTFQPIFRLHSNDGERLPWDYGDSARTIAEAFMRLRESLVPYIYTLGREAFDTGMPITRGLYLVYPDEEDAYRFKNEYLFGDALLVAPVTSPSGSTSVWFPAGTWTNIFTGERIVGPTSQTVSVPLDTMPVYARAGAIIPRQPPMSHVGERPVDPLVLDVYVGADGAFSLYEDDGEGLQYRSGRSTRTPIRYAEAQHLLTIDRAIGHHAAMVDSRAHQVTFFGVAPPATVTVDGRRLAQDASSTADGWRYDQPRHALIVHLRSRSTKAAATVSFH